MKNEPGPKLHIKDVHVCNEQLYREVAALMKMDPKQVKEMAMFTGQYIAGTIARGNMETVMLRYFGKFKPKKELRLMKKIKQQEANGMNLLYRAIKGKKLIDKREQQKRDWKEVYSPGTLSITDNTSDNGSETI